MKQAGVESEMVILEANFIKPHDDGPWSLFDTWVKY
jgi:hypothetical protein